MILRSGAVLHHKALMEAALDKLGEHVQTPQENEVEQIYFRDSESDQKKKKNAASEQIGVKSDSSCQIISNWLILSLLAAFW